MQLRLRSVLAATAITTVMGILNSSAVCAADTPMHDQSEHRIALYLDDGSAPAYGLQAVNEQLLSIGVHVSEIEVPPAAQPILRQSIQRALTSAEARDLIQYFKLDRQALLKEIRNAGRLPTVSEGGHLQTSEQDVAPYPKVYDMQALDEKTTAHLQHKFGRLHVNSTDEGVGIDEVMTIVSGGPYTWFFLFDDNRVGKLRFGEVGENDKAWRISYPGLVPHGGYFDAPHGLVVAYAHGPEHFVMRYEHATVAGKDMLGLNPWIDFAAPTPKLRREPARTEPPAQN